MKTRNVLDIPETAARLRIGRSSVYRLIYSGDLETTDVGTGASPRTRVFEDSVTALLDRRASSVKSRGRAA